MRSRALVSCIALALSVPTGGAALAQPAPSDAEQKKEQARALFAQGLEAQQRGELQSAYGSFTQAWQLHHHYKIAGNLGGVELELGKPADAALHLSLALADLRAAGEGESEQAKALGELYDKARAQVATVVVSADSFGAPVAVALQLDGKPVERGAEDRLFVAPGEHELAASAAGRAAEPRRFQARAGEELPLKLRLRHAGGGISPSAAIPPEADGGGASTRTVLMIAGFAAAGAGAGVGIAGSVLALGADDEAGAIDAEIAAQTGESTRVACSAPSFAIVDRCNAWRDELQARTDQTAIAVGGFVAAGTALIATGTYLVWTWDSADVALAPGPGTVTVRGSF